MTERLYSEVWWERLLFRIRGHWSRRVVEQRLRRAASVRFGISENIGHLRPWEDYMCLGTTTAARHLRGPNTVIVHLEDVGPHGIVGVCTRCGWAWSTVEARITDDAVTCRTCLRLAG